jgi:hypothetical protein
MLFARNAQMRSVFGEQERPKKAISEKRSPGRSFARMR